MEELVDRPNGYRASWFLFGPKLCPSLPYSHYNLQTLDVYAKHSLARAIAEHCQPVVADILQNTLLAVAVPSNESDEQVVTAFLHVCELVKTTFPWQNVDRPTYQRLSQLLEATQHFRAALAANNPAEVLVTSADATASNNFVTIKFSDGTEIHPTVFLLESCDCLKRLHLRQCDVLRLDNRDEETCKVCFESAIAFYTQFQREPFTIERPLRRLNVTEAAGGREWVGRFLELHLSDGKRLQTICYLLSFGTFRLYLIFVVPKRFSV